MSTILAIVIAYLLGSLSSSVILCKITKSPDPREEGSKNPGATNVLRLAGKKLAALTLLGDVLKGVIAVFIGKILGLEHFSLALVALAVFIGHLYPVFFKFKGGKGFATFLGILLAISPFLLFLVLIVWLIVALVFRYSSLSTLVSCAIPPIYMLLIGNISYFFSTGIIVGLLYWRHRENIVRLLNRTESKIKLS